MESSCGSNLLGGPQHRISFPRRRFVSMIILRGQSKLKCLRIHSCHRRDYNLYSELKAFSDNISSVKKEIINSGDGPSSVTDVGVTALSMEIVVHYHSGRRRQRSVLYCAWSIASSIESDLYICVSLTEDQGGRGTGSIHFMYVVSCKSPMVTVVLLPQCAFYS